MKVKEERKKKKGAEKENSSNISSVRLTKQVAVNTHNSGSVSFLLCSAGRDHKVEHQTRSNDVPKHPERVP